MQDERPERRVVLELIDAEHGRPVDSAADTAIALYREPTIGIPITAYALFGPDSRGRSDLTFVPTPSLRWIVHAPGYREARGQLTELHPERFRVTLTKGFERRVLIRDRFDGSPLSDVEFVRDADGTVVGRSDRRGYVRLEAAQSPGLLLLQRDGYETRRWDPDDGFRNFSPQLWLQRTDES